jgi:hypothetical protein
MPLTGAEKAALWRERDRAGKRCWQLALRTATRSRIAEDLEDFGWLGPAGALSEQAIIKAFGEALDAGAFQIKLRRQKNP